MVRLATPSLVLNQMTCWGGANFGNFGNVWGRVERLTPARDPWPTRSLIMH
jgi:hypothetical protein